MKDIFKFSALVLIAILTFTSCEKDDIQPIGGGIQGGIQPTQLGVGFYTATQVANQSPTIGDHQAAYVYFNQPGGYQGPNTPYDQISGWGADLNWRILGGIILDGYNASISAAANRGDAEYFLTAMPVGTNPSTTGPFVKLTIQGYNKLIAVQGGMATNAAVTGYEVFQFRKAFEDEDADGDAFTNYEYSGLLMKYEHPVTRDGKGYITSMDTTVQLVNYYDRNGVVTKTEVYSRDAKDAASYYRTPDQLKSMGQAVLKEARSLKN